MFVIGTSDSDSENDVWVGPYTMKEAIYDVTRRRRAPIDHRHSCISSFRHYDARGESSDKSTSETSFATACDTVDNTGHNKNTADESIIEQGVNSDESAGDELQEENMDALTLKSKSSQNCYFQQCQSSNKTTLESSYSTACSEVHNRSNRRTSKKLAKGETYKEQAAEDFDSEQSSIDDLHEEALNAIKRKSDSSKEYNFQHYYAANQSADKNTVETSYTTACSEAHNRSNHRISKKLAKGETYKEQAAEDCDSESYENLSALSLESKSSEDYSFQHYYDIEKRSEKNAQESVHNKNSQRISKKLWVAETYKETAEENIAEDFGSEQCSGEQFQGENLNAITLESELSKYDAHKKWNSYKEEPSVESIAREVYTVQSSISEFREENLTAITLDSDSSKDYASSSAYPKSTHEKSASSRSLASAFNPEDDNKSKYNSDSLGIEESVANLQLHLKPGRRCNKTLPTPDERLSDSFTLDDTMEEVNQFIQQGPDYVMSPKASENLPPALDDFVPLARSTNFPPPGSVTSHSTKSSAASANFKSRLPTFTGRKQTGQSAERTNTAKSVEKPDVKKTQSKDLAVKSADKAEFEFKVPRPPLNRTPRCNFKYTVSPVGIYIKYTPRYTPFVKVPATSQPKSSRTKLFPAEPQSKENIPQALNCEIPAVIYKPAATRMVSEQQDVKLPNSIKKLVSPQVVTKHERRIERQQHNVSIDRRLLESDLTINAIDDNPDISIVVNKQPFNIKKL